MQHVLYCTVSTEEHRKDHRKPTRKIWPPGKREGEMLIPETEQKKTKHEVWLERQERASSAKDDVALSVNGFSENIHFP